MTKIIKRAGIDKGNGVGTRGLFASVYDLTEVYEGEVEELIEEQVVEREAFRSNAMIARNRNM